MEQKPCVKSGKTKTNLKQNCPQILFFNSHCFYSYSRTFLEDATHQLVQHNQSHLNICCSHKANVLQPITRLCKELTRQAMYVWCNNVAVRITTLSVAMEQCISCFFHAISQQHNFWKKNVLKIKCVFWFSLLVIMLFSGTYHFCQSHSN